MVDYSKWDALDVSGSSDEEEGTRASTAKATVTTTTTTIVMAGVRTGFRTVAKKVLNREQAEGAGARVRRSIGGAEIRQFSPFLLLDVFNVNMGAGFPPHPHRGFETVTYMLEGAFQHEDFKGHRGTINAGDLQWMTAGRGIVHAEMPATNGRNVGLQLWVNLPRAQKLVDPRYQELLDRDIPRATSPDGKTVAKVIAGEAFGVTACVRTYTPIYYLDFTMEQGGSFEQRIPTSFNAILYTISGKANVGGAVAEPHTTLLLDKDGDAIRVEAPDSPARFVVIAGEPISEPVVQHGPFVMNDQREIYQAFQDYQNSKNGFENAQTYQFTIA